MAADLCALGLLVPLACAVLSRLADELVAYYRARAPDEQRVTDGDILLDATAYHRRCGTFRKWAKTWELTIDETAATIEGAFDGRPITIHTGISPGWASNVRVVASTTAGPVRMVFGPRTRPDEIEAALHELGEAKPDPPRTAYRG